MKKTAGFIALAALAFLSPVASEAQNLKIGTVDMKKIFESYYKTKDAEARINEARATAKQEVDERTEALKKNYDALNKLNEEANKPELSKDSKEEKTKQRDERLAELRVQDREFQEFKATREKQLQDQNVRMRNVIVEEIMKVIQDKVQSDQYDIVFDRSGMNLSGVPVLLSAKDSLDFTDSIVSVLNSKKEKDKTSSAPAATPNKTSSAPAATPKK